MRLNDLLINICTFAAEKAVTEYTCEDCDRQIFDATPTMTKPPEPPVCAVCQAVRYAKPEDREALRKVLVRGTGFWKES